MSAGDIIGRILRGVAIVVLGLFLFADHRRAQLDAPPDHSSIRLNPPDAIRLVRGELFIKLALCFRDFVHPLAPGRVDSVEVG
jgi:hypothetical protein